MWVQNKGTKAKYEMTEAEFEGLGARKAAFTVLETAEQSQQTISNAIGTKKPEAKENKGIASTGNEKSAGKNTTQTNTNESKS